MDVIRELKVLSEVLKELSSARERFYEYAKLMLNRDYFTILAPHILYSIALEASLKFIEITYTYSTAMHILEFRHGPVALLERRDKTQLIVLSLINNTSFEFTLKLVNELRERGFNILHISNSNIADFQLPLKEPTSITHLSFIKPLYYITTYRALQLGYNPDNPKHIEKIVKVI